MRSPLGYEGRRVVVSGGGGAGMGAAAVRALGELGAEVHVLDLREPTVEVASHQAVDLRDPGAAVSAVERIGAPIDALFNAAGLPGPPFSDLDTMLVNFAAPRHLTLLVAPRMTRGGAVCSIASTAGSGYLASMTKWMPLVDTPDFAAAQAWCETHPGEIAHAYPGSKEALILWTMRAAIDLAPRGIRLNCISPGPTDTPMIDTFVENSGVKMVDAFAQGLGRRSTSEEQAWPMIFLNSPAASYVTGENINTDGGTVSAITTGRIVIDYATLLEH